MRTLNKSVDSTDVFVFYPVVNKRFNDPQEYSTYIIYMNKKVILMI